MSKTISFHCGSEYSRGHNIRDERYVSEQKHIDTSLSVRNEIVCDEPVRKAYDRLFRKAVEEYNARQTRADRRIDDYYTKIKNDKRKKPVYECIIQIGDRYDTGNNAEQEKDVLREYAKSWNSRNPSLALIGAYIHADEPNGTVHLHCDFIPVAESSRGLNVQNSFSKALASQGFVGDKATKTAQMKWQERERIVVQNIARSYGINATANQSRSERPHLTKAEYIHAQEQMREEIAGELEERVNELNDYLNANKKYIATKDMLDEIDAQTKSKGVFSRFRKIDEFQYEKLLETAHGASALQLELKNKQIELKDKSNDLNDYRWRALELSRENEELKKQIKEIKQRFVNCHRKLKVATEVIQNNEMSEIYDEELQFSAGKYTVRSDEFAYPFTEFEQELKKNKIAFRVNDCSLEYREYSLPKMKQEKILEIQNQLYDLHNPEIFQYQDYGYGRGR